MLGVAFPLENCPRCRGEGFYFDITFNKKGEPNFINKEPKLAQDVIKILLTRIFENLFIMRYGTTLKDIIGTKINLLFFDEIRTTIARALSLLASQRVSEEALGVNIDEEEKILGIDDVRVELNPDNPTSVIVTTFIRNGITTVPITVEVRR